MDGKGSYMMRVVLHWDGWPAKTYGYYNRIRPFDDNEIIFVDSNGIARIAYDVFAYLRQPRLINMHKPTHAASTTLH